METLMERIYQIPVGVSVVEERCKRFVTSTQVNDDSAEPAIDGDYKEEEAPVPPNSHLALRGDAWQTWHARIAPR